jgi:hypothetical protein
MAFQLLPIIKAVAPYLAQVATAAVPVFKSNPEAVKLDPVVAKQIEELQAAVTQNAKSIQVLAEKTQQVMRDLENAAQDARKQVAAYKAILLVSLGLSALSLATCLYLLVR